VITTTRRKKDSNISAQAFGAPIIASPDNIVVEGQGVSDIFGEIPGGRLYPDRSPLHLSLV
jgi:hypothetical protein